MSVSSGTDTYSPPPETFYLAYRGSIAHGMYVPPEDRDSIDDIDLMGFVFGEPRHYFGLHEWASRGTKEVKAGRYDVVLYEIRKAFSLLLRGNPNIMLMLWIKPEHRLLFDDAARELVDQSPAVRRQTRLRSLRRIRARTTDQNGDPRPG
jgi:predicted nucleotidyltransferase